MIKPKNTNEKETQLNIAEELEKCKNSPYYFAITYLTVETATGKKPYQTILTEKEFNKRFKKHFNND
jgi:hypothetical protein